MTSTDDFFSDFRDERGFPTTAVRVGRGGARPNTGPKAGHQRVGAETPTGELNDYQRLERAKADKETALARQAKVKADLEEGRVVDREAVRQVAAQAFAAISQALDAIPDALERQLGLPPETAERVGALINAAKSQLVEDLKKTHENAQVNAAFEDDDE